MTTDNMDTKTMGDDYKDEDGEMEMTKTNTVGDDFYCVVSATPRTVSHCTTPPCTHAMVLFKSV